MLTIILTPLKATKDYLDSLSLQLSTRSQEEEAVRVDRAMPGTRHDGFMLGALSGTYRNQSGAVLLMGPNRPSKKQLRTLHGHYGKDSSTHIVVVAPSHYDHNTQTMRTLSYWEEEANGRPLVLETNLPGNQMAHVLKNFLFTPNRSLSAQLCADPYRARLEADPTQINEVLATLWREGARKFV